jgi:N-acetylmuramoyl-L-alanine amidase CwlA
MANTTNSKFIGIECCHPDATGKFKDKPTAALVWLVRDLCGKYGFDSDKDVFRHYDVTGKQCPMYYVNNSTAWKELTAMFRETGQQTRGAAIVARLEKGISLDKGYWLTRLESAETAIGVNPEYLRLIMERILDRAGL